MTGSSSFGDEQYRIPKTAVGVEILLDGGRIIEGHVYVGLDSGQHLGRERVVDLLHTPELFFPVRVQDSSYLLMKERIVWMRVQELEEAGQAEEDVMTYPQVEVEILLANLPSEHSAVDGMITLAMPTGRGRLLDWLNGAGTFFPVRTAAGVVMVNRRYVVELRQY